MTAFQQNFTTYAGDSVSPTFTVFDQNGNPLDISSVSGIAWSAQRTTSGSSVLTKTLGSGITLVGGGTTGQFTVAISASDIASLSGVYLHQAAIVDSGGNQSTVALGQMTVGKAPSWTYDATQLGTSPITGNPLMQVRRLIGDTKYNDQQLFDEEINFALAQRGYIAGAPTSGVIYAAASDCCRNLAAEMSRQVDLVQGELKTNYSNRAKAYMSLSLSYENFASFRGLGTVYGGGLSVSDKQSQEANTNRVSPSFAIGMMDDLILAGPIGPETPDFGSDELPDF